MTMALASPLAHAPRLSLGLSVTPLMQGYPTERHRLRPCLVKARPRRGRRRLSGESQRLRALPSRRTRVRYARMRRVPILIHAIVSLRSNCRHT